MSALANTSFGDIWAEIRWPAYFKRLAVQGNGLDRGLTVAERVQAELDRRERVALALAGLSPPEPYRDRRKERSKWERATRPKREKRAHLT